MSERISIDALKPGMVIIQITEQNGPVRIRKSGLVSSDAMVQGLREMGVLQLEIDPAQTVELAGEESVQRQSQTQFLLQSNTSSRAVQDKGSNTGSMQDSQLAEQFNRSLFLPTAQEIPDSWQLYLKQGAMALATIIVGFGIGFGASQWMNAGDTQTVVKNESVAEKSEAKELASTDLSSAPETSDKLGAQTSTENTPNQVTETTPQEITQSVDTVVSNTATGEQQTPVNNEAEKPLILGTPPEDNGLVVNEQGEALSVDSTLQNGDVSPELLQKFQKAMADLEQQEQSGEPAEQQKPLNQVVSPDVPRVDQMPGWILSSLPRMSFSAHMYASEPADRWVKVNDIELGEGDWVDGQLRIERIEPQHVILSFQGHEFSMQALSEW
ncbi:general secretion pathway protein GspB [Paraneptunicella aestuarii]|uniref:general secretion pathway protein GspB n=1 Tax=Paraneptunicella aestuarii TaxID=2831148 RepID=UPI001E3F9AE8|nr:general secretion pathway protein GspB [Paraneptunicella aestuarii]UAA37967.1 general secretion pathway protein GspB [Paraneptunicella aestuarii]